jgi:hypothetical protein
MAKRRQGEFVMPSRQFRERHAVGAFVCPMCGARRGVYGLLIHRGAGGDLILPLCWPCWRREIRCKKARPLRPGVKPRDGQGSLRLKA